MENVSVLIIDDEQGIINSLTRLLKRHGYQVLSANNGADGIKLLAENHVAVVVCDQQMPGMNGHEVLREAGEVAPQTQRIMLTGDSSSEVIMRALNEKSVSQFIPKPWDDIGLIHSIQECVRNYNLELENVSLMKQVEEQNELLKSFNKQLEGQVSERNFAMTDMLIVHQRTEEFFTKFKEDIALLQKVVNDEGDQHSLAEAKEPLSFLTSEIETFITDNFDV